MLLGIMYSRVFDGDANSAGNAYLAWRTMYDDVGTQISIDTVLIGYLWSALLILLGIYKYRALASHDL